MSHARSFGAAADAYDRYRPSYAPAAVTWAVAAPATARVADLGAGTGILSRLLRGLGHEVIAVEPDDAMRARLVAASPGITATAGSAERIPLPDNSVDAVVAGQSYHWFDPARAHTEIARVLRPGGTFAAMWNDADPAAAWTVRLGEIIDGPRGPRVVSDFGPLFGPVEEGEFRHEEVTTPEEILAMATTRSPYLVAPADERAAMLAAVRTLIEDEGLTGRVAMPHITRVHRAFLAS